jgi:outer membrane protein TolC
MKKENFSPFCILVFVLSILAASGAFAKANDGAATASGPRLSLSDYLTQVSEKHLGFKAADQTAKAAKKYAGEGSLLFEPNVFANASETADARNNPTTTGDYSRIQNYSLGVSEQTNFGLTGKVSYNGLAMDLPGLPSYNANYGAVELSQSLLRNWGGQEARAQSELIETSALAKSFGQSYQTKAILLEAESLYWRLALAREMVQMQKDAVDRAQKIYDWTNRRVRLQLADRAENLQASTNLQARKIDLQSASDDERAAAQAFNASRGTASDQVAERLTDLNPEVIGSMSVPARASQRDDVKAAEYQAKANAASALLSREKDKPTLEVFGSTLLNDPSAPPAQLAAAIPPTSRPGTTLGLRLNAPLDLGTTSKAREGYAAEARAADWTYQRKTFEEERDWQDLTAKFRESKSRLKLYSDLERTQKEKLDYERDRQQRGRSTLQQVLLFENDFEIAQLGRIRTLADLLTLNAQMKLYGVSNESR